MGSSTARLGAGLALASSLLVPPIRGQISVYEFPGEVAALHYGASVAGLGDLDGDGTPDFAVGSRPDRTTHYGVVEVRSGATGSVLWSVQSGVQDDDFGAAIASVGDIDLDGVPDVAVGAPRPAWPDCGCVRLYSGRNGAIMRLLSMAKLYLGCAAGYSLAAAGDLDLDGVPDILVGSFGGSVDGFGDGHAAVFSGSDGSIIHEWRRLVSGHGFGWSVAGPGDLDGDGYPDVVVGAPLSPSYESSSPDYQKGTAYVFSGHDGALLRVLRGQTMHACFGSVAAAGDVDLDGRPDLLVGAPGPIFAGSIVRGSVTLFSGSDFSVLWRIDGEPGAKFGLDLRGGQDVDRDGRPDVVVGAPTANAPGLSSGSVSVHSGRDGSLLHFIGGAIEGGRLGPVAFVGDLNHDGACDIVTGIPGSGVVEDGSGRASVFLLGQPVPYDECIPTFNSFDCGSSLMFQGTPSVSLGEPFVVISPYWMNQQPGRLLWGFAGAYAPLGNGTLCVRPRFFGPLQNTGGSEIPASDCSGELRFRFTREYLAAHGALPGKTVHCQFQSRDPHILPPNEVMLSDALVFTVIP